ncbi:hypothetical protein BDV3_005669 [Batrachochytrium dendrobatidis]|uniref:DM13 domain-containing protein n=1 Tax=Batrachochytrium dendrobatidis (strain JEL423) TaxID=403673 RepID=A0A177WIK5_BATDL|nr:hypothetical protein O5D80_003775 [Batrachochytrium dendrobatidis]KAK5673479.1 hypothetical protein QVD99_000923 [Batrachochytrium dendrobatidis]OAJ39947.1 hypothetical protein BDEG_23741 [Batrachochytrium dendrobatidis JEL423]
MISTTSALYTAFALLATVHNSVNAQSLPYGLCDTANFQYSALVGKPTAVIPIKQIPLVTIAGAPLTVKGSITIIDGCHFEATDFVFTGAGESYWYGSAPGSSDGVTLVDTPVAQSANPAKFSFAFTQVAGRQVNWQSFTEMRLFEKNTNGLLATVTFPGKLGASAGAGAPTPGAPTTGGSGSASPASGASPAAGAASPAAKSAAGSDRQTSWTMKLYQGVLATLSLGAALVIA